MVGVNPAESFVEVRMTYYYVGKRIAYYKVCYILIYYRSMNDDSVSTFSCNDPDSFANEKRAIGGKENLSLETPGGISINRLGGTLRGIIENLD